MYDGILRELSREYEKQRDRNVRQQILRKEEVYRKIPAIEKIDEDLSKLALETSRNIIQEPEKYRENLEKAREKMEKLQMDRSILLTDGNIPLNYLDIQYKCDICQDKGYLDNGDRCSCLRQKLVSRAYQMSNIEDVLDQQNFNSFDINKFSDEAYPGEPLSPRENMMDIYEISRIFIENIDKKDGKNLLFYGDTGLGKTFLSNCIAKELLDRNYIVIYQTAFTILDILEKYRFKRGDMKLNEYQYNLLFEGDLLIIDDLGTELSNSFTNAEIFNIVNTRNLRNKKTIISSNLSPKEISATYTDRIFSRILEKFLPLKFYGRDLRN